MPASPLLSGSSDEKAVPLLAKISLLSPCKGLAGVLGEEVAEGVAVCRSLLCLEKGRESCQLQAMVGLQSVQRGVAVAQQRKVMSE